MHCDDNSLAALLSVILVRFLTYISTPWTYTLALKAALCKFVEILIRESMMVIRQLPFFDSRDACDYISIPNEDLCLALLRCISSDPSDDYVIAPVPFSLQCICDYAHLAMSNG